MTSVLGWDAPTIDPTVGDRLIDLGVDFLIDRTIASLLEPPGSGRDHKGVRFRLSKTRTVVDYVDIVGRALTPVRDRVPPRETPLAELPIAMQPWFDAAADVVRGKLGERRYDRTLSFMLQALFASEALTALAYARQGLRWLLDPSAPLLLAAPLVPAAGRVADGPGPVAVFEIGEPTHPFASQGHADARAALGPLNDQVRWHWIHGPSHEHAQSLAACCLVEAALEQDPMGLWTHAPDLMKQAVRGSVDLEWLNRMPLTDEELSFLAEDPRTAWRLFQRAGEGGVDRLLIVARSRVRGSAAEMLSPEAIEAQIAGAEVTGRQHRFEAPDGTVTEADFLVDIGGLPHGAEVKGWSTDMWTNVMDAYELSRAGVALPDQARRVAAFEHLVQQLDAISQTTRMNPIRVVTDALDGPARARLVALLEDAGLEPTLVFVDEAELVARGRTLRDALGLP